MADLLVIADTSCLIVLQRIGQLDLLNRLFDQIVVTHEVALEFGEDIPSWIIRKSPSDQNTLNVLVTDLDAGEASAIALALESEEALLLIDEKKGRRKAQQLGLRIMGTLGVLIEAQRHGHLTSMMAEIEKMGKAGFYLAEDLVAKIKEKYG